MSMLRCDNCDKNIDTDFDAGHFEECIEVTMTNNLKEEKLEEMKCIMGHCDHAWNKNCWYADTWDELRKANPKEDLDQLDQTFDAMADLKMATLINQKEKEARIDELKHLTSGSEYSADDIDWYEKEYDGSRYYYSEVPHINIKARIKQLKEELNKKGK